MRSPGTATAVLTQRNMRQAVECVEDIAVLRVTVYDPVYKENPAALVY